MERRVKCTNSNYPRWTCSGCAEEAGGKWPRGHVATWHSNICPVCGEQKAVTEPRDYRYPDYQYVIKDWKGLNE